MSTLTQLLAELRSDLDDQSVPYFWSDDSLVLYINEAINEVVRRARLIRDDETEELTRIDLWPGTSRYALDPRVLHVHRVQVVGALNPLKRSGYDLLDHEYPGWQESESTPLTAHSFLSDVTARSIRIVPRPTVLGMLRLVVERLPLHPLSLLTPTDEPEIPEPDHYPMLNWARHLAYMKQDSDAYDPEMAAIFEVQFTLTFGPRPDAASQEIRRTRRDRFVRPDW